MSESNQPMFQLLLKTLEEQSPETKAMFFADSEKELLKAYQEGREARKKRLPMAANPYPPLPPEDEGSGKYNKSICWSEGFLDIFVSEL